MRRNITICLLLAGMTLAAFWPIGQLGYIIYDDHLYVTENAIVQSGLTIKGVLYAFTTKDVGNWHPVTWLSHMLDFKLFGLNPAGHHWVNLGFHIANTLLLFIVLRQMTQTVWRSALVAALFALHPTHVQSVAWISERKDLLSGFFFLLTLWAWTRYAQGRSKVEGRGSSAGNDVPALDPRRWTFDYFLALGFFALGLMSKPMLVTLPFVLLLLDFWPLKRMSRGERRGTNPATVQDFGFQISDLKSIPQPSTFNHLLFEKLPFAALSLASCIVTVWAQHAAGAVMPLGALPWYWRIANSLVFYTDYLGKMFWPVNLAILYPYPYIRTLSWDIFGAGLLMALVMAVCLWRIRSQPWLLAGWLWFVVMLVPVIGLVQVGMQSIADRYTYLPSIGLFMIAAWGMGSVAAISNAWRINMSLVATVLLLACLLDTRHQLGYWRNSVTLFDHVLEVTRENNFEGYYLMGNSDGEAGDLNAAAMSYRCALEIAPNLTKAHAQLGRVLMMQKKFEEAGAQYNEILQQHPYNVDAHKFLGDTLAARGKYVEAKDEYSTALQLKPDDAVIRTALAFATRQVETQQTVASLYEALKTQPTAEIHGQIAAIQTMQGKFQEAGEHYAEALRLRPDSPDVLNNLAWLLATCPDAHIRDGARAVTLSERACELTQYHVTPLVGTLAAAYAEASRYDEAVATAEKACALASASGDLNLLKKNQELLARYERHQPYHEPYEEFVPAAR